MTREIKIIMIETRDCIAKTQIANSLNELFGYEDSTKAITGVPEIVILINFYSCWCHRRNCYHFLWLKPTSVLKNRVSKYTYDSCSDTVGRQIGPTNRNV